MDHNKNRNQQATFQYRSLWLFIIGTEIFNKEQYFMLILVLNHLLIIYLEQKKIFYLYKKLMKNIQIKIFELKSMYDGNSSDDI